MAIKHSQEHSQAELNLSFLSDRTEIHDCLPSRHTGNKSPPHLKISIQGSVKATSPALALLLNILPNCLSKACLCPPIISWGFRTTGLNNVHLKRVRAEAVTCQGHEFPKVNTLNWPFKLHPTDP